MLLDVLKQIKKEPPLKALGICFNIKELVGEGRAGALQKEFLTLAKNWPKHSGSTNYPVGGRAYWYNEDAPRMENPLRLELLDFCIEYLEGNYPWWRLLYERVKNLVSFT